LALALWFVSMAASVPAAGQLRDSFEGPQGTWSLKQADCGVRELVHDRDYREARSGQASEHFRLSVGNGTFVYLAQSIGRAPLIDEFRPTLFVKADRPSVQLMARVVLPRSIDRGTGQPVTTFLRGEMYAAVGQWQQLAIRDLGRLFGQEVRSLRTQFGAEIDEREAYIDLIVLNAYSAPGTIDLWIDDLEIEGYVNLDDTRGPQVARRSVPAEGGGIQPGGPTTVVRGSMLMVRGRPFMMRAVQHRGEPLEWLRGLGFNTIKLSGSPSATELKEARRLSLYLVAPPPYSKDGPPGDSFDPVIAWSLGSELGDRDLVATRDLIAEIHSIDGQQDRPLLAGVEAGLNEYSRVANLLFFERSMLGTTRELADLRPWLLARTRLARPGTPALASIETQRASRLAEQLLQFSRGTPWEEDVDPEQLRLEALHAIAAGARGLIFQSSQPLAIDTGPSALRTDAIRLVNMELRLLEPWIAAGQLTDQLAAGDGTLQVSVLQTDRSRLLIATQHAAAQQFALGPPPRSSISLLVPGVGASDQAYLVSLAAITKLKISHTSGGARIALENAPHAAAIVITQDHLAMHHLQRTLDEIRAEACRLRYDVTTRRLIRTVEIDRQLAEMGHPLSSAAGWLRDAHASLEQARRLLEANDVESSHAATTKAEHWLERVRRGHWEQTAAAFPSPAASPCIAQFTTLPLHWSVAERIRAGNWGPNVQAAGDMESLDHMLNAGWKQQRPETDGVGVDVSLSLAEPRSGRSALRLQAWAADAKRVPPAMERPLLWVSSSPIPIRQGQLVRIHGWVNVPRALHGGGTNDGLVIFDSIGGSELGDCVRLTRGWREFTLYRAAPQSGELSITFALHGLGEASLDDLSVSLLDPEPIRPAR
jgi:hypothetical protein